MGMVKGIFILPLILAHLTKSGILEFFWSYVVNFFIFKLLPQKYRDQLNQGSLSDDNFLQD